MTAGVAPSRRESATAPALPSGQLDLFPSEQLDLFGAGEPPTVAAGASLAAKVKKRKRSAWGLVYSAGAVTPAERSHGSTSGD